MDEKKISIYTDGSCLGNPGFGGWAALILSDGNELILSGCSGRTTNNRMEMKAIIEALRKIKNKKIKNKIHIFSDSSLLVNSITKGWKRKKNHDLWSEFDAVYSGMEVHWHWIRGHAGNKYNTKVDAIAVQEALKAQKKNIPTDDVMDGENENIFSWVQGKSE